MRWQSHPMKCRVGRCNTEDYIIRIMIDAVAASILWGKLIDVSYIHKTLMFGRKRVTPPKTKWQTWFKQHILGRESWASSESDDSAFPYWGASANHRAAFCYISSCRHQFLTYFVEGKSCGWPSVWRSVSRAVVHNTTDSAVILPIPRGVLCWDGDNLRSPGSYRDKWQYRSPC